MNPRTNKPVRQWSIVVAVAGVALLVGSCTEPASEVLQPLPRVTTTTSAVLQLDDDEVTGDEGARGYSWPNDAAISAEEWARLKVAGFEFPMFSTVEDLANAVTTVVVARRLGTGPSVTLGGDPDNNEVSSSFSLVVEVLDVVRSQASRHGLEAPEVGERLTVIVDRRPGKSTGEPALLFLRQPGDDRYYKQVDPADVAAEHREYYAATLAKWEEYRVGKYELMTSQSLLVGDSTTTVNPMRDPEDDPLSDDITGVPIAQIVERIRSAPAP